MAFDVSDFQGSGQLTDVAGIRIQGTSVNSNTGSVDLGVIGYNTSAVSQCQVTTEMIASDLNQPLINSNIGSFDNFSFTENQSDFV